MALKLGCEICALKFGSDNEVVEHYCSLPHQIKQARLNPKSKPECALCLNKFETLAEFSRHLDSDSHAQTLERFRRSKTLITNQGTNFTAYASESRPRLSNVDAVRPSSSAFQANGPSQSRPFLRANPLLTPRSRAPPMSCGVLGIGRGVSVAPPPWFPPGLPQTLRFAPPAGFAEDAFNDLMLSFQSPTAPPPPPPAPVPLFPSNRFPPPRPAPASNDQSRWRPPGRRVFIQSSVTSIEPGVPIDIRHLGQNERHNPTTLFTKKKQRQEYLRSRLEALEKKKKKVKTSTIATTTTTVSKRKADDGVSSSIGNEAGGGKLSSKKNKNKKNKNKKLLSKKGKKRKQPKSDENSASSTPKRSRTDCKDDSTTVANDRCDAGTSGENKRTSEQQGQEADSTTSSEVVSLQTRKAVSTTISAAAFVKRHRLVAKAQQRTSDRLLADRLSRYRLVITAVESPAAASSARTAAKATATTSSTSVVNTDDLSTTISTSPNPVETPRIDATVRQRARNLFLSSVHSARGPATSEPAPSTSAVPETWKYYLREPKAEVSDAGVSDSASEAGASSSCQNLSNAELQPITNNVRSLASSSPTKNAPVSALQELWQLCKREEQIRVEKGQLNEEMERLKQEIHRVWYRQKELQKEEEECVQKKKALLDDLHEKETTQL